MLENHGKPWDSSLDVRIRKADVSDSKSIREVFRDAFENQGEIIARLAIDLLSDESGDPSFALLAESAGETVGGVIFSAARISGSGHVSASILAPLAVIGRLQRKGIGKSLIEAGFAEASRFGIDLVFVLGDPAYYGRLGFTARHHVQAPYDLPYPEAWMARGVDRFSIASVSGKLSCARTLMAPEHW